MNFDMMVRHYNEYEKDDTIQRIIAQANSRYILYNSMEPEEKFPRYIQNLDERCLHIVFSYLNFGWNFYDFNRSISLHCMEKAAEVLEHLYAYRYCDKIYREYYSLICALSYYISSHYSKSFIVLKNYACNTNLATMIHYFVVRDLKELDTIISSTYFQVRENDLVEDRDSFIYTKILANAFNDMLKYIYTGEYEFMDSSKKILLDLIELASINNEPHIWWVFRLLYLIFDEYREASLWSVLPPIIANSEDRNKYIRANIYKKKSIVELFKSQRECIQQSEKYTEGFVVGMPTSAGKTKVAEISLVRALSEAPNALCVYLAPFRSLANEIEASLSQVLGVLGYTVSHLYGSIQVTQRDRRIVKEASVIIATPEKMKSILRSNPDLEDRIKLVIVDEGHLVGGKERYITSELFIEELRAVLAKTGGRMILLSAVLPNLTDFSLWVNGGTNSVACSEWRPSAQRFGELSFFNHTVNLNWIGEAPSVNNGFIISELKQPARITKKGKKYSAKYFPEDKKEAVGATAVKMLSMGSVLIYVGKTNMVLSQARVVSKLLNNMKLAHQWENTNDLKHVELTCEEAYGKNSEIYAFVKQGIICHSSKLPMDVRQSIERLMAHGTPKVVIATTTLGQGVNLGVSTVIFSNVYLGEKDVIDVKDFWNIAGRAGRAFTDTEGKILYVIDRTKPNYSVKNQLTLMEKYLDYRNIEKANSGLLFLLEKLFQIANQCGIDYTTFLELLAENCGITTEETEIQFFKKTQCLLDLLDDTLLSMSIKYEADKLEDYSDWIDSAFRTSLAYIQASNNSEFCKSQVIDILKARNRGVIKIAGGTSQWKTHVTSSIPLKASIYIDIHLETIIDIVKEYIDSWQTFDDLMDLIQKLDTFIALLPITFEKELLGILNQFPIRDAWYSGKAIEEIVSMVDKADLVCNKYYSFHFPWVVNAMSKKLLLLGKTEEAELLENISVFSEIGVPDALSSQIYLAGIRSRRCSIELSSFIVEKSKSGFSVKKQLIQLIQKFESGEINLSDKAYQWLTLLNSNEREAIIQEVYYMKIRLNYSRIPDYEQLYCRDYEGRIYLCTWDYKIKLLIRKEFMEKYICLVGLVGIYFRKIGNDLWELVSENPYVIVLKE